MAKFESESVEIGERGYANEDHLAFGCVHRMIERQCQLTPAAVAVSCDGQSLTYFDLDQRSNRLAKRLRSLGVGPEVLAGVLLERSVDIVVALLAILKAGGAYVPLDPSYPKARLQFMLDDSRAAVLITQESLLAATPSFSAITVSIDNLDSDEVDAPLDTAVGPDNCAYVIYTSGSTGRPKGVQVLHRSMVNFLASMQRQPGLAPSDRLLAVTTLSFDIAGLELFLPLVTGAHVTIAPRSVTADGAALARMLNERRITVMQATPVTWRLLLDAGWKGAPRFKILCGGEALSRELAERLLETGADLWNLYGPTETTVWSALHRVQSGDGPVPIGKSIANTWLYILDENLKPAPPGTVGELYIGGEGVARGYLDRPELTASHFRSDPFRPGNRIYRTGDLAQMLPDGTIECLGRMDQQVKIRGFRIELGEIEAALQRQAGINAAVVIVREDSPGDQRLAAYIVCRDTAARDSRRIREALQEKLPEPMVPSAYVFLDALPLTPNLKVDRKALPKPDLPAVASPRSLPPRTETERQVAAIWQELLKIDTIGAEDNFLELGGHSLLIAQLQFRLTLHFGHEIATFDLIKRPTVASMAALLDRQVREGAKLTNGSVPAANRAELSSAANNSLTRTGTVRLGKSLVALRSSGSNPPLFVLPGGSFSVLSCTRLATALGPEQPVYGFHARGLDGIDAPLDRVEDFAAEYLREMQSIQKHGPYHILGICFGGPIAFEMARLLEAQGERVETLAMIGSPTPDSLPSAGLQSVPALRQPLFYAKRVRRHFELMRPLSARERLKYARDKMALLLDVVSGRKIHQGLHEDLHEQVVRQASYSAVARYRPGRLNTRLLLIVADHDPRIPAGDDPRLRWRQFTRGGAAVHRLPGATTGALMREPTIFEVAGILTGSIEGALETHASSGL